MPDETFSVRVTTPKTEVWLELPKIEYEAFCSQLAVLTLRHHKNAPERKRGSPRAIYVTRIDDELHNLWKLTRKAQGRPDPGPLTAGQEFESISALAKHLGVLSVGLHPRLKRGRNVESGPIAGAYFMFSDDYSD